MLTQLKKFFTTCACTKTKKQKLRNRKQKKNKKTLRRKQPKIVGGYTYSNKRATSVTSKKKTQINKNL